MIMSGPDWKSLWIHVPGGLLGAALLWLNGPMGVTFNLGFLAYEFAQDWRIVDHGFKDILGHVVGLGIGGVTWLVLQILGVI